MHNLLLSFSALAERSLKHTLGVSPDIDVWCMACSGSSMNTSCCKTSLPADTLKKNQREMNSNSEKHTTDLSEFPMLHSLDRKHIKSLLYRWKPCSVWKCLGLYRKPSRASCAPCPLAPFIDPPPLPAPLPHTTLAMLHIKQIQYGPEWKETAWSRELWRKRRNNTKDDDWDFPFKTNKNVPWHKKKKKKKSPGILNKPLTHKKAKKSETERKRSRSQTKGSTPAVKIWVRSGVTSDISFSLSLFFFLSLSVTSDAVMIQTSAGATQSS